MIRWYVLHCKPRKEQFVYEQLLIRNIEVFFPCNLSKDTNRRKAKPEAFFPGYIFVHTDLDQIGITSLQWLPGVIDLVKFGGIPAHVPDSLIHAIQSKIKRRNNVSGDFVEKIKPGDSVKIIDGPLTGYKAIFDSRLSGGARASVLLHLISGQKIQVQLPITQLYS